jgi:asparagine synthase (glutamine-hydrolysing)
MCGILGTISFSKKKITLDEFKINLDKLQQRGPDAVGIFENQQVFLAQRRLSIIDTSEGANQPFIDTSGNYVLVFNGEIFNFNELKKTKLSTFNIQYKTNSDTEVLMYLLIHYGTTCLNWLSGFFAFAFYNKTNNETLLARDRFGKKPLIIYQDDDQLIFGSELKALINLMPTKKINPNAVALYFQYNYIPPTLSVLEGVRKLKPGHFVTIKNNSIEESEYYKLAIKPENYNIHTYENAKLELVNLMQNAVRERMISDVPLGAFLSGGIDSSVVVALAAQETDKLKTYSIGFKDNPIFDETKYAQLVAKKYNTDHHAFYLDEKDYKDEVFNVLEYLDEPFADSSCIPQYILCKKTKKHVTVALSGDGADEMFAGYNKHKAEWTIRNNKLITFLAKAGNPIISTLPQNKNTKVGNFTRQLAKLSEGASMSKKDRFTRWSSILNIENTKSLFSDGFKNEINSKEVEQINSEYNKHIITNDFNEQLLADMNLVLPADMLHKVDMMSMANSLEVRSPFLDYKVVDFAFSIPPSFKIDKQLKKKIVQDAFREYLPEELYNRPKQGFEIPLLEWFRTDFSDYIFNDLLKKEFIEQQNIFNYKEIEKIKQKLYSDNPGYIVATIWALIVFQYWYKKYIN